MAKIFLQLLVLVCAIYIAFAATGIALPHPKYPRKCFDGETTYDAGTYYTEGVCEKKECNSDFTMYFYSCPSVEAPEGYQNVPDLSKKYPDCCINFVKTEDAENIIE